MKLWRATSSALQTSTCVSPLMQLKPPYHPIRDFTAVAQSTVDTTPEAFEKFVRAEYENFRKLITEIGLKPQ